MVRRSGYLVVQKSVSAESVPYNPSYRGVDRLVPWSPDRLRGGLDDPYLDTKIASDDGIIFNAALAKKVKQVFSHVVDAADLEILFVRDVAEPPAPTEAIPESVKFLGFDVAGDRPFRSLAADFPSPSEAIGQEFRGALNEHGLFSTWEAAKGYYHAYLERYEEERDQGIVIWEVYLYST